MNTNYQTSRRYTPERLELELSPAKWDVDREFALKRHHDAGKEAVEQHRPTLDVRYGSDPLQTLDIFASESPHAPCCLLIHGGFWRISDKSALSFVGGFLKSKAVSSVVCNFDMCPAVTLDQIVRQVADALSWLTLNASQHGLCTDRILLFGHATGAHLAAMMLSDQFEDRPWASQIAGSFLISGLYDLRPVPSVSVNSILQLDASSAERNSPLLRPIGIKAPVIVAAAGLETAEFRAQSHDYACKAMAEGVAVTHLETKQAGHFSILDAILDPADPGMTQFISLAHGNRAPRHL